MKIKIKATVDKKGRIIIPAKVRREMRIEPMMKVDIRIERVFQRRSFLEIAKSFRSSLKKRKDVVKLLHEESPFR
ncbi:MAG: hypothetical protein HY929_05335 [Euryarchaeota archaeon]|nr:hypothetical protein [Euryarchaeota archaeon]